MTAPATTATLAVQEMLYGALDGALSASVYDYVAADTPYPYVTIGDVIEVRDDAHNRAGKDLLCSIHVWSRDTGYQEAQGLVAEIDAILDQQMDSLSVSGWTLVLIENESTRLLRNDNAGEGTATRHAILQYRIRVHE